MIHLDSSLLDWATDAGRPYIEAAIEHGGAAQAGRALGVNEKTVRRAIKAAQVLARASATSDIDNRPGFDVAGLSTAYDQDGEVRARWTQETPSSPFEDGGIGESDARDGGGLFSIKGVSTLFGPDGQQRAQWVKTRLEDTSRMALIRAAFDEMAVPLPRLAPLPAPARSLAHLLNVYTMTDCHIGMLAWHKEGGQDWDLETAERELIGCFRQMILSSPPSKTCVINQLGDWMHFDGFDPVTPTSRHIVDADSRFQKVVLAALRVLRAMIEIALQHHEQVHLINAEGNHDLASSVWLRVMFKALYENEPRVTVDDSALPYYQFRHGKTVLWFHHGHLKKPEGLPGLLAAQFPKDWGETTKRYIHVGHCHTEMTTEYPGVKLVQHPTLAARDAYAARHGFFSERQATAFTYHSEFGQVGSSTVTPEMLTATEYPLAQSRVSGS